MKKERCQRCGGKGWVEGASVLRARRLRTKTPLRVIARTMKISAAYLSDLERGKRNWNADLVNRFETALAQAR